MEGFFSMTTLRTYSASSSASGLPPAFKPCGLEPNRQRKRARKRGRKEPRRGRYPTPFHSGRESRALRPSLSVRRQALASRSLEGGTIWLCAPSLPCAVWLQHAANRKCDGCSLLKIHLLLKPEPHQRRSVQLSLEWHCCSTLHFPGRSLWAVALSLWLFKPLIS